jgi:hypothetical protein
MVENNRAAPFCILKKLYCPWALYFAKVNITNICFKFLYSLKIYRTACLPVNLFYSKVFFWSFTIEEGVCFVNHFNNHISHLLNTFAKI